MTTARSEMTITPTMVARLPEAEFRTLVDDDTRDKATDEVSAVLRSPEVVARWYETLLGMQKSVEGQLAAKGAEARSKLARIRNMNERQISAEFGLSREAVLNDEEVKTERWKAGAIRFKSGLEQKLLEARRILRETGNPLIADRTAEERNQFAARVGLLEAAIRRHRDAFPADDDPSDADEELWSYVGR